jgi:hypothetical protein
MAIEAVQRTRKASPMRRSYDRIVERRGGKAKNLAEVAAARKLLTLVYYGYATERSAACPGARHARARTPTKLVPSQAGDASSRSCA